MLLSIISSQLAVISETQPKKPSSLAALLTSNTVILHSNTKTAIYIQVYHFTRGSALQHCIIQCCFQIFKHLKRCFKTILEEKRTWIKGQFYKLGKLQKISNYIIWTVTQIKLSPP